ANVRNLPQATIDLSDPSYLTPYNLKPDYFQRVFKEKTVPLATLLQRDVHFQNASLPDGAPLISLGLVLKGEGQGATTQVVIALLRQDKLLKVFSRSVLYRTFLIDNQGNI